MNRPTFLDRVNSLLANNRFWILTSGITLSFFIAGFVQLFIPAGSLQSIRIEQTYGFVSFFLLFIAVVASPFVKVFPNVGFNPMYLHARRAIGVLSFYYAFLHVYITFFTQLNGFEGLGYLDARYSVSLWCGIIALGILAIMTMTSLDVAVKKMHFKNWKLLHRLVYFAGIAILVHVAIIGPHFDTITVTGVATYACLAFLLVLEIMCIRISLKRPGKPDRMQ